MTARRDETLEEIEERIDKNLRRMKVCIIIAAASLGVAIIGELAGALTS